ncbi:MAG: hypothetical protein R3C99_00215 [Pirellulaceae bacterium]
MLKPLLADEAADDPLRRSAAFHNSSGASGGDQGPDRGLADAKQPAELRTRRTR